MDMLSDLRSELQKKANSKKAKILAGFFKTGDGQYGYGDVFLGVSVPDSRKIAIGFRHLPSVDIKQLLASKIHEERLIALLILVHNFSKGSEKERKIIFDYYIVHTKYINNWDLVDLSADKIVGGYLLDNPRNIIYKLAKSENIWEKRISMIATHQFIKEKKEYKDTFAIAEILLHDKHDLIQKAVGWMLREVGKRCSQEIEEEFLKKQYKKMPRTALRYAIERFPEPLRRDYLAGKV